MSENYTRSFGEIVTGADASTVATVVRKPGWAHKARVTVAADSNVQPCPEIRKAWIYENGAGSYTDVTDSLKSKAVADTTDLSAFAADDFIYIGADLPFRALAVNLAAAVNGTESVITVSLSDGDGTWTDSSDTDGTISSSKTFAQDGVISWAVPATWLPDTVNGLSNLYWIRIAVSVVLDSSVTVEGILLIGQEALGGAIDSATAGSVEIDMGGLGGLDFTCAAGTPANSIAWVGR